MKLNDFKKEIQKSLHCSSLQTEQHTHVHMCCSGIPGLFIHQKMHNLLIHCSALLRIFIRQRPWPEFASSSFLSLHTLCLRYPLREARFSESDAPAHKQRSANSSLTAGICLADSAAAEPPSLGWPCHRVPTECDCWRESAHATGWRRAFALQSSYSQVESGRWRDTGKSGERCASNMARMLMNLNGDLEGL